MRGLLDPSHYTDQKIFEAENDRIFGRLWIFAGLAQLVDQPDEFLTRRIGGRQVVVQNIGGVLHAFENVCLHRGRLLQSEWCGRRPLVCGYHGWRYATDGSVASIPFDSECYELQVDERRALGLTRFPLERIGNFIFVNVCDDPLPITSQFNAQLLASIESVSEAFDSEVLVARFAGRFNWKLAYENLRDGLHPRFVHTQSLNREVKFEAGITEALAQFDMHPERILAEQLSFGGPEGQFLNPKSLPFHESVVRWGTCDAYFNWLLYPNTHVVSPDGGYSFSVEHHEPIGPDRTDVTLLFLTARKRRPYSGSAAVLWEYAKAAKVILDEDTEAMEQAQSGMAAARRSITQGRYEMQNRITDHWYLRQLSAQGASGGREYVK